MSYALITGASKGIGRAMAIELAQNNYNLLLTARSYDLLKQVAEEIKKLYSVEVYIIALDLFDNNSPQKVYDWCIENRYEVSVLINNAGSGTSGPFQNCSLQKNTNQLQLNVIAPTQLCQLFIPLLQQHPNAYIMNVASTAAYQAVPFLTVYSASKAYLQRFSRSLSRELSDTNISVTCISPGPTDTDFAKSAQIPVKTVKLGEKLNMKPAAVAKIAVRSMFAKKTEIVPGFINKLGVLMAWLLPKKLVEKSSGNLYK